MSIRTVALNEAVDLIDSPRGSEVLVLLADDARAAALRSALLTRKTARSTRWIVLRGPEERPGHFSRRICEALGPADEDESFPVGERDIDRALDALVDSAIDYSLIIQGIDAGTDPRVLDVVGYLLEFLPTALRVVFIGEAPGVGLPRALVRRRAQVFSLAAR